MQPGEVPLSGAMARAVDLSALKSRAPAGGAGPGSAGASGGAGGAGGAAGANVVDVTEATFQAEVLERSLQVPVVLDLWADWCGPCKQLSPVLEKLAAEGNGAWVLAKIDVDANPAIAQALRVQGIPAVKAVFQGQLVDEFTGALPEPQVRQWIGALLEAAGSVPPAGPPPEDAAPADPQVQAIEAALQQGDLDGAEEAVAALLAEQPDNAVGLRWKQLLAVLRRAAAAGPDAVAKADAAPADIEAQLAAADVQVAGGQFDLAFARLVEVVRGSAGDDRNRVRTRLLELFTAVGDDDRRVAAARRDLTSALF